jgi:hypothetical protein
MIMNGACEAMCDPISLQYMLNFTIMILVMSIVASFLHQVYVTTISSFTCLPNRMTSSQLTHLSRLPIHGKDNISSQPQFKDIAYPTEV